jgi:hypothetical protein
MSGLRHDRDADTEPSIRDAVMATIFIVCIVALLVHAGTQGTGESSIAVSKVDPHAATTDARLPVERPGEPR